MITTDNITIEAMVEMQSSMMTRGEEFMELIEMRMNQLLMVDK